MKKLRATPTGTLREEEAQPGTYREGLARKADELGRDQKREMKHNPEDTITYTELTAALGEIGYNLTHADRIFDKAVQARERARRELELKDITPAEIRAAVETARETGFRDGKYTYSDFADTIIGNIIDARAASAQPDIPAGTIVRAASSANYYRRTSANGWQPVTFTHVEYPGDYITQYAVVATPVDAG